MAQALPVIVNAAAGKGYGEEYLATLGEAFRAAGAQARILAAKSGTQVAEIARREALGQPTVLIAAGGDGTVSTVASAVVGTQTALGILPLGTLNHFAKDLRIPLTLEEAARTIVANHQREVDVGEVNGRIFINNSSIGLYPTLVIHREAQRRRLGRSKWHALFWATMSVLRRHSRLDVRLSLDNVAETRRTPLVFIGNNAYVMEGFDIGTRERLDTGELSLYLTLRQGRWALVGLALRALFGTLHQTRDFEALTAHTIGIATRHKFMPVATDGEVSVMATPLDYRIRPRALRVIAPAPEGAQA
jgi:diacylglycerol kinase family enzyme